jgi:predicted dehydrogenase
MPHKPLNVAVIGTGFIGRVHVRSARLAGAQVIGVAASTAARSRDAAASMSVPKAYANAEEAIADRDVDVVHICTPNSLHAAVAKAALEADKHVVCEKPLATSLQDARALAELAKAKGLIATVPFVNRFHPMVREARARVQSSDTGKLYLIQGSYLQDWLLEPGDTNWRVDAAAGGASRAFADIGSHLCDLLEWITGERFVSLIAVMGRPIEQRASAAGRIAFAKADDAAIDKRVDTEDLACLLARTDKGTFATLTVSQVSAGRKNRLAFEIDGAHQSIQFDSELAEQLWIGKREETRLVVRNPAQGDAEQRRLNILPPGHAQGWGDAFAAFVSDTYAAIRGERPDGLPGFEDGARSMSLIEAVLRSSAANAWTSVSELQSRES